MTWTLWHADPLADLRLDPQDPRPPAPLVFAAAFVVVLVVDGVGGLLGVPALACFLATLLVVGVACWFTTPGPALLIAVAAFLALDGFAIDAEGDLAWHGGDDLVRLVLLVVTATAVSVVRERALDRARLDRARRELERERRHAR